jgi:hypothetical protein
MIKKFPDITTWLTWSTCSIALLPAVPNAINSISMMVWAALTIVSFFVQRRSQTPREKSRPAIGAFLLLGGNFVLLVVSLIYSIDKKEGANFLVTELPMLLFPLCFFVFTPTFRKGADVLHKTLTVFWFSTVLMTLWVFFQYGRLGLFRQFAQADSFNTILRQTAETVTDKHSDYLSIYLVFSLFIAAIRMLKKTTPLQRIVYALSIPLQGLLLFLLAARSPIIALVIGSLVICFLQIKKPATRWIVLLGLTACFLVIIRLTPSIWSRIEEVRNTPLATPVGVYHNSTNIRVGIYKCAWQLVREYPLTGIGAGSDRRMLTACYAQFPTDVYQKTFYNTHDQYLNFWLLGGLPSLVLFLAAMVFQYRQSIRQKDYIFLFFLLLMTIAFATENILSRQAGIVFYYFFSCCFLFNIKV